MIAMKLTWQNADVPEAWWNLVKTARNDYSECR